MSNNVLPTDRLVRIKSDTYKIVNNKNGELGLVQVSEDDIAEYYVLGTLEKMYALDFETLVANAEKEITESAKSSLKDIVAQSLGFSNRWSKWEINDNGRGATAAADLISKSVRDIILQEQLHLNGLFSSEVEKEQLKTAVAAQIKKNISETIRGYGVENYIKELIATEMKDVMRAYIKEHVVSLMIQKNATGKLDAKGIINSALQAKLVAVSTPNPYGDTDDIPF